MTYKKLQELLKMKTATLFGGAMPITNTIEYIETVEIGKILAENNYNIKNGGYYGLMEAVSKGASTISNAKITGITVKTFPSSVGNKYLTETIVADDIYHRLKLLISDTDIFIIQKGGFGTLSELFLLLDVIRKMKNKPTVILFGDSWYKLFNYISDMGLDNELTSVIKFVNNMEDFKTLV